MAVRGACIWVLITDGVTARICSTGDGLATPVVAPMVPTCPLDGPADIVWNETAYRAWFSADSQRLFPSSAKGQLALHLAQLLNEGARDRAFSGLIVVAAPQIRWELKQALSPETRALLIGKIVRDLPVLDSPDDGVGIELRH